MKRGIIKGFIDRAKALCDKEQLQDELTNVEDVFVANGYTREYVKSVMTEQTNAGKRKEQETIGQVRIPYITGFSEQFKKIAQKHKFEVTLLPGVKLKSVKNRCQIPLDDKRSGVVYQIPCECGAVYTGETKRKFETRLNEYKKKVQLVSMDVESGNIEAAMRRMEGEDGGLARHDYKCRRGVKWEDASIVLSEQGWH